MASQGKEYLVAVTSNGLAGGTQYNIDYQGDLDFSTGKSLKTTMFKQDQAFTSHQTQGAGFTMDILAQEPLGPGAVILMDAADNQTDVYVYVQTSKTGGQRFAGKMKVALTNLPATVNDPAMLRFQFGQSGTITRSTV